MSQSYGRGIDTGEGQWFTGKNHETEAIRGVPAMLKYLRTRAVSS